MALLMRVENTSDRGAGIWTTGLSPREVRLLGNPSSASHGVRSVIGLRGGTFTFDKMNSVLSFDPLEASVLIVGTKSEAIFLDLGSAEQAPRSEAPAPIRRPLPSSGTGKGDAAFRNRAKDLLGDDLAGIASAILEKVRQHHPGELAEGKANKWVNRPQNFFAMTPQGRDRSIAVNVYGLPHQLAPTTLDVRPDRGYSRFKVSRRDQVEEAVRLILRAASLK